jgi:hypothetical protein
VRAEQVQEELVKFVQALAEDDALYGWFTDFSKLPLAARGAELTRMATEMRQAGEHSELIHATELLRAPQVFDGVTRMLEELRGAS